MKIQILIPQYNEDDSVVKPMLDSIALQQQVDFKSDVSVIIVNDGSDVYLSDELLNSYPYHIDYYKEQHRGVSGARNSCLDHATADYVMFCDADDMFCSVFGLYIILREINGDGFDSLISVFVEESMNKESGLRLYVNHDMDATFVHGKVHRRRFLIDNNIRWNENLTIHEDSYFNFLCQALARDLKHCPTPFYLWKWRDESVCRHDSKYILKTYNNMLDSNTDLVKQFLDRRMKDRAQASVAMMVYDAYYTMNKKEWIDQANQEYRRNTELRFKKYYEEFKNLFDSMKEEARNQIIVGVKNRFFNEGLFMESITFDSWIKHIEEME